MRHGLPSTCAVSAPSPLDSSTSCACADALAETRRAEKELTVERDLLRCLMDNVPDHIYFKDERSRFLRINRAIADQFHVPAAIRALEAGKHVLVEKPLGTTVESCRQLRDRAATTGLVVQVGNNRRFDPGIAFARQFVAEELGERIALKA